MLSDAGIFAGALVLVSLSSLVLSTSLERVGVRLHFTHALLGIVTALGADAPEIAASISSIRGGHAEMGYGIVLGSSVFNLAALMGVSAILTGIVRITWRATLFNGVVAIAVALAAALVVLAAGPTWVAPVVLGVVFLPYVVLCARGRERLGWLRRLPWAQAFFSAALGGQHADEPSDATPERPATAFDLLAAAPALASIVFGTIAMVHSASSLGHRLGFGDVVIGSVVLAALTGVPNLVAALRLARRQRGAVVISEAFNSNTLVLAIGIILPSMLLGVRSVAAPTRFAAYWLVAMTIAAMALTLRRCGLRRLEGLALVIAYAVFVVVIGAGLL